VATKSEIPDNLAQCQAHHRPVAGSVRPTLAVSIGDPLGIGPEIIVKALADPLIRTHARFHIYGTSAPLVAAARLAGIEPYWLNLARGSTADSVPHHHEVVLMVDPEPDIARSTSGLDAPGPSPEGGSVSFCAVDDAIAATSLPVEHPRHAHAIVTAPISKTSWRMAGHTSFPGHTEMLAHRLHAKRHAMLFVGPSLRVILVTIHVPLMTVGHQLSSGSVLDAIELAHAACRELGIDAPRLAVCGLNPHAGEGGLLGSEDGQIIAPAIHTARERLLNVTGPWPADTLFSAAAAPPHGKGKFDCVVAMYHDQGLIPVKLLDGMKAVNVTVGLPTIRTSPAHGTAFDIAGRDLADPTSMRCAIELAISMATRAG